MKNKDAMERRRQERRQIGRKMRFPLTDSSGCVVPFNRSRQPERRNNNYAVKEIGGTGLPTPEGEAEK